MTTTSDPAGKLVTPEVEIWWSAGGKLVDFVLGNAYSLGYYVNLIISLTGTDPVEKVQNYFGGDWEELLKAAKSVENLANFNTAYSDAITETMKTVESSWDGNAASAADDYFSKLTAAIDAQVDPLTKISDTIATFAWAAYGVSQEVQTLLQEILDLAVYYMVMFAASIGAAAAGPVAVIGFEAAKAAIAASMVVKTVKMAKVLGGAVTTAAAAVGAVYGLMGSAMEFDLPSVGGTYDHPGVV